MLQLTLDLVPESFAERRRETRTRTESTPARLTDLYRDRIAVTLLNVSPSGLGVKVEDQFEINLPVLLECDGLLIVGTVRHCLKAANGGYILGLKTYKVVDASDPNSHALSDVRAVLGYEDKATALFSTAWCAAAE